MALRSLSGTASHILRARGSAGATGDWNPELTSRNGCSFRIGSRSVRMSLHERPRLKEGDHVTVVGTETARGFVGYAMRNDSAGVSHCASEVPTWALYVGGAVAVLVGIPFSPMLIGIPVLAAGMWVLYLAHRNSRAIAMLDATVVTPNPEALESALDRSELTLSNARAANRPGRRSRAS